MKVKLGGIFREAICSYVFSIHFTKHLSRHNAFEGIQTPHMQTSAKFTGLEPLFYRNIFKHKGDASTTHTEMSTSNHTIFVGAVHSQEEGQELNDGIAGLAVTGDKSLSTFNSVKHYVTSRKKAVIKDVSSTFDLESVRVKEIFTQLVEGNF